MGDYAITHSGAPNADDERAILLGIARGDPPDAGPRSYCPLSWILRAPDGSAVGGLLAARVWNWFSIEELWVDEPLRGRGFGGRLLQEAEEAAAELGCTHAMLGTFDFQARGFYERHGYRVYGQLEGFPAGHIHYHMTKSLEASTLTPGPASRPSSLHSLAYPRPGPTPGPT
jgi:GNAT superfamily N-acetyltransferase